MTPPLVRLGRARLAAASNPEPPVCNADTYGGFCHLDEGHDGGHLPPPANYPPSTYGITRPKTDGGPSLVEFLRSKGELA